MAVCAQRVDHVEEPAAVGLDEHPAEREVPGDTRPPLVRGTRPGACQRPRRHAVLGTESTDAWAIWRDITAAVQADEDTGTGVRLIPPAPFAGGLRAVAVPSEQ